MLHEPVLLEIGEYKVLVALEGMLDLDLVLKLDLVILSLIL